MHSLKSSEQFNNSILFLSALAAPVAPAPAAPTPAAVAKSEAVKQRQSDLLKSVTKEPEAPLLKDPPAEFEFTADPPSISGF